MKRRPVGFTIVELLIVIVVIAILAAITVVAFNGIQERARESRASSQIAQASKKIALWQVDNPNTLPATLSAAGVSNTDDSSYHYRRYDNNSHFCLSVTLEGGASYYMNSSTPSSTLKGSCSDIASVAGNPLAYNSNPGTAISFPALSGTPDVILYGVVQINNTTDSWRNFISLQPSNSSKNMQLDTADAGSTALRYRLDTSASANINASQNIRTVGRHIGWVQVKNNMTAREFAYDQAAAVHSGSLVAGSGWDFNQLSVSTATSSTAPIAAVVYNAVHDQQTRARVMQWLADTHNVPMTF